MGALVVLGYSDSAALKAVQSARKRFEKPPAVNLTGTMAAFRPDGSLSKGRVRPASTGDYQPWTPD